MGFEILTLSPLWFIAICALAALSLTWLLYRKHFFENKWLLRIMMGLRFFGLFIVFTLLLAPMVRLKVHRELKPKLLLFLDQSMSVKDTGNSGWVQKMEKAKTELSEKYDAEIYGFAGGVARLKDSTQGPGATSLSSVFDYINEVYEGKSLAGIVMISDGISNRGLNPLFQKLHKPAPIYTVGLGDTTQYPDAWVTNVDANSTVFFENDFGVEAGVRCTGLDLDNIPVELWQDGVRAQAKMVNKAGVKDFYGKVEFLVKAGSPGVHRYEVRIPAVNAEKNPYNNAKSVLVNVTDTRKKIALVAHAPNPDMAALARSLESSVQYSVARFEGSNLPDPSVADIFVCHGFAASDAELKLLQSLQQAKKPFWVIFSAQTNPGVMRNGDFGFDAAMGAGLNDAQAVVSESFGEFVLNESFISSVKLWPPLRSPYGRYKVGAGFKSLLWQRIGAVNTDMPLMGFSANNNSRQAWLFGEGLWRWRLKDFEMNRSHAIFDELVSKTIQYLGTAQLNVKFRAFPESPENAAKDNVVILAEYLDQNMELNNKADAELQVKGANNFQRNLKFARTNKRYRLDIGSLAPGTYSYTARIQSPGKEISSGIFTVTDRIIELENTVADHGLLRRISQANNGTYYEANRWSELVNSLKKNNQTTNILAEEIKVTELIHWKWLFALIILLFGAEWFIRKREGGY